jgi:hypothetical protein
MEILTSISNAQLKDWLIVCVGSMGLLWYYLCIADLGFRPTQKDQTPTGFRQFQSLSVTTISVSLATYVGYVIGLPTASDIAAKAVAAGSSATAIASTGTVSNLQAGSAMLYVLSLVTAVYFYYKKKDETEPAITGLAKSLLGFFAGVFSVALTVPHA